jgi:hypothetical protein
VAKLAVRSRLDPLTLPGTGESPAEVLERAVPLWDTAGQEYVERRGISPAIAMGAGVRFAPDFAGRPAVLAPLYDHHSALVSVHGRYLHVSREQDKMLTIGPGGGVINILGGWRADPLIIVEGLFDALSLASCGFACVATIGRLVPWLAEIASGRTVLLAFDASRSGDDEAARLQEEMRGAHVQRIRPPGRSKDWNTAMVKRGRAAVSRWLERAVAS